MLIKISKISISFRAE